MQEYETIHLPETMMKEINTRRGIAKKSTWVQAMLKKAMEAGLDKTLST